MGDSREKILENIKQALATPVLVPFPDQKKEPIQFPSTDKSLKQIFEETFTGLQGEFFACENQDALATLIKDIIQHKNWKKIYCKDKKLSTLLQSLEIELFNDLASCDVCITDCEALVSRTGSIVLCAAQAEGRTASVYAPAHLCIATALQLHYDLSDAIAFLKEKYNNNLPSFITFASGPSRTADIEKTLVTGVHGPKEVSCILIG